MNDIAQRRLTRLAGLLLAALLLSTIVASMAVAKKAGGSGAGSAALLVVGSEGRGGVVALSGPEPAAAAQATSQIVALSGPEPAAAAASAQTASQAAAATWQGRGGIASAAADTPARSQPTPTDSNAWAAILFSLAALLVGAVVWIAIDRRRARLTGPALAAFCARNPADSLCGAT